MTINPSTDPHQDPTLAAALIACARQLNPLGINHGKSGNVSVRADRDGRPGMLITASGLDYEQTQASDLVWMALQATPGVDLEGDGMPRSAARSAGTPWADARAAGDVVGDRPPSSEWRFHRDLYRSRADLAAIVHTHARACTTLACIPQVQRDGIPPFHYMIAMAGGDTIACAPYATFGTQALSEHVVNAMAGRKACLMANHGMLAAGASLQQALAIAVEVESLAAMYLSLLGPQQPVILDAQQMAQVHARFADYGR